MRGSKPKGNASHQHAPGKGKIGRVNSSEPLLRLRKLKLPDTRIDQDGNVGAETWRIVTMFQWSAVPTRRRSIKGTHPSCVSMVRNVATPMGSDPGQYSLRKSGWRSQWEQEGPRSESQQPKGNGKS